MFSNYNAHTLTAGTLAFRILPRETSTHRPTGAGDYTTDLKIDDRLVLMSYNQSALTLQHLILHSHIWHFLLPWNFSALHKHKSSNLEFLFLVKHKYIWFSRADVTLSGSMGKEESFNLTEWGFWRPWWLEIRFPIYTVMICMLQLSNVK